MDPQYNGFNNQDPGEVDMVIGARIQNPYIDKCLTIISGEFENLNGKIIGPGQPIEINFVVPAGYREYIKPTSFNGKAYVYIGLRDGQAADPIVHKPSI